MSVSANDRRHGPTTLSGAGETINADFRIQADADPLVWYFTSSTSAYAAKTLTTDYTIANKTDTSFQVVFNSDVGASGDKVWILDKRDIETFTNFLASDSLPPETFQKLGFDILTEYLQSMNERLDRALQLVPQSAKKTTADRTSVDLDIPDFSATEADYTVSVNSTGDGIVWAEQGDASSITITTFGKSLVDDNSASEARTTLELVLGTDIYSKSALDTLLAAKLATGNAFVSLVYVSTGSSTTTVPANATKALAFLCGGGGGGGGGARDAANAGPGGGGGSSPTACKLYSVVAGQNFTYSIGTGGTGGTGKTTTDGDGTAGSAGSASTLDYGAETQLVSGNGGGGRAGSDNGSVASGTAPTAGSGEDFVLHSGGTGTAQTNWSGTGPNAGAPGASSFAHSGGEGENGIGGDGEKGSGGGGGKGRDTNGSDGGDGGDGWLLILYFG